MAWFTLAAACAVFVAPDTTAAIIDQESGGSVLAIHVNGLKNQPAPPHNIEEAVLTAQRYISRGYTVDMGLMQVNSANLPALHASIVDAFVPCANIHMGATILAADYAEAASRMGGGRAALLAALSAYNTGNFYDGFLNGYVNKYTDVIPAGLVDTAIQQKAERTAKQEQRHVVQVKSVAVSRQRVATTRENQALFFN